MPTEQGRQELLVRPPPRVPLPELFARISWDKQNSENKDVDEVEDLVAEKAQELVKMIDENEDLGSGPYPEEERADALAQAARELFPPGVRVLLKKGADSMWSGYEIDEKDKNKKAEDQKKKQREHPLLSGLNVLREGSGNLVPYYKIIFQDYIRKLGNHNILEIRTLRAKRTLVMSMIAKDQIDLALWYLGGCDMDPPLKLFPPDLQFGEGSDNPHVDIDGKNFLMYVYENESEKLRDFIHAIKDERVRTTLINQRAESQKEDSTGETILMKAARDGNTKIMRLLLKYKADPHIRNKNGETAAFYCVRSSNNRLLKYFFTKNGSWRTSPAYTSFDSDEGENSDDDQIEHSEDDDEEVTRQMQLERRQQEEAQRDRRQFQPQPLPIIKHTLNQKYQNLLHVAAQSGNADMCKKLITEFHFTDMIDAPDADRRTPLIYASMQDSQEVVKTLLEPEMIKEKPRDPKTGLEIRGAQDIQVLRWNPADKYAQDKFKKVALQYALEREDDDMTSILIGRNTDTSARAAVSDEVRDVLRRTIYDGGVTPLMKFVGKNSVMVDVLLQSGVDPNAKDARKRTALMYMAANGFDESDNFKESLRQLLLYEAVVDSKDALGRTALHLCTKHFNNSSYDNNAISLARTLINSKGSNALLKMEDNQGRVPLAYAAIYGFGESAFQEVFGDLNGLELGQILNDDVSGMNPLLWAAYAGRDETSDLAIAALKEGGEMHGEESPEFIKKIKFAENLTTFAPREKFGVIEILARKKEVNVPKVVRSRCSYDADGVDGRLHAAVLFAVHYGRLAEQEEPRREEYTEKKMAALELAVEILDEMIEDGMTKESAAEMIQRKVIVDLAHKKRAIQERMQRQAAIKREDEKHKKAIDEYQPNFIKHIRDPSHGMFHYQFGPSFSKDDGARLFGGALEATQPPAGPKLLVMDDLPHLPSRERKEGTLAQVKLAYVYSSFPNEEGFICGHQTIWKVPGGSNKTGSWTGTGARRGADKYFPDSNTDYEDRDPIVGLRIWYDTLPQEHVKQGEPNRAVCAVQFFRKSNQSQAVEPQGRQSVLNQRTGGLTSQVQSVDLRIPPEMEVVGFAGLAGDWLYEFGVIMRARGPAFKMAIDSVLRQHPPPTKHQLPRPDDVKEKNPTFKSVIEMLEEIGPDAGKLIAHPRVTAELEGIWRGDTKPDESIVELAFVKPFSSFANSWEKPREADEGIFSFAFGRPFHKDHGWFRETDQRAAGWNLFARKDMFFGTPRGKFFMEFAFYIMFLANFTWALNWQTEQLNLADVVMAFLLVGFVVSEGSQAIQEGLKYFTSIWNFADVLMVLIFGAFYYFRVKNIFSFDHVEVTTAYRILAFNSILLWTRLLNVCDLHSTLGPLLTIIKNMATDTLTFLVVLLLVMLGFSQLIHILIIHILETNEQTPQDTVLFMFKTILGDSDIDFVIEHSSMVGFAIYSFYLVFSVIMLLNLLIAVYGGTYGKIADRAEEQFQYTRAATYLEYAGREYVPPPFNLIQFLVRVLIEWPLRALDKLFCGRKDDPDSPNAEVLPSAFGKSLEGLGTKVSSLVFMAMILPFAAVFCVPYMLFYLISGIAEDAEAVVAASENAQAQAAAAGPAVKSRDAAAALEEGAQKARKAGPVTIALARGVISVNDGLRALLGKRDASSAAATEQLTAYTKASGEEDDQKVFDLELWEGERKEDEEGATAQMKAVGTAVDLISQRLQDIEQRVELSSIILTHVASGKGALEVTSSGSGGAAGAGMMDEIRRTMQQLTKSIQPGEKRQPEAMPPPPPPPPRSAGAEVGTAAQTAAARVSVDIQRRLADMEDNLARRMEHIVDQRLSAAGGAGGMQASRSAPYPSVSGAGAPPASAEELAAQMRAMNTNMQEVREYIQKKKKRSWFG
eukprot:tig00000632_g2742.t1